MKPTHLKEGKVETHCSRGKRQRACLSGATPPHQPSSQGTLTGFQRASCLSLMRLNPVVKTFPSERKMALIGRAPSCAFSFSWRRGGRGGGGEKERKEGGVTFQQHKTITTFDFAQNQGPGCWALELYQADFHSCTRDLQVLNPTAEGKQTSVRQAPPCWLGTMGAATPTSGQPRGEKAGVPGKTGVQFSFSM